VSKFCRTVARALARAALTPGMSSSQLQALALADGGPREPLGAAEGLEMASLALAGGVLRGIVGMYTEPYKRIR
jgi:hypothetical protein